MIIQLKRLELGITIELENQINKIKTRNVNVFDENAKQSIENELNSFSLRIGILILLDNI